MDSELDTEQNNVTVYFRGEEGGKALNVTSQAELRPEVAQIFPLLVPLVQVVFLSSAQLVCAGPDVT